MNRIYRVAIIGGGAAGLMSAVELTCGKNAIYGNEVLLLERNDRVGKKLVATGNGQGNLTNAQMGAEFFHGKKAFIEEFIAHEKQLSLKKYLTDLGIVLTENKDGKIYPLSKQASAVLDILREVLKSKGVEETVNSQVKSIKKEKDYFVIKTDDKTYCAKKVIVAVGGSAGKQFGTDGTQYKLLESFGHKTTKVYPSLVQLKTDLEFIKGLKGLKETAKVTAICAGKELKSTTGDLLFTEFGVSGSSIFAISSAVAGKDNVELKIEFVPELTEEQLISIIEKRKKSEVFRDNLLLGVINKRIGQAVLKRARGANATEIAIQLKNFRLKVTGNLGFNYAQVTRGGIVTDDVDPKTYESNLVEGLYIVGEVLDVDGDCGGYNLTFAFVSGIISARSALCE